MTLESVQMPALTTTGKNLFDVNIIKGNRNISTGEIFIQKGYATTSDFSPILSNQKISFSLRDNEKYRFSQFIFYDENKNFISNSTSSTTTTPANAKFIHIGMAKKDTTNDFTDDELDELKDMIQIEYGDKTSYEPFKSNLLTLNEEVELRGIGNVKDDLNLLTGELTQYIGEIILDGSENEWYKAAGRSGTHTRFALNRGTRMKPILNVNSNLFLCDKFKRVNFIKGENSEEMCLMESYDNYFVSIIIENTKLNNVAVNEFKLWLQSNNVKLQYVVENKSVKTVGLNSTYSFQPVMNRDVYISGNILPLVCSVTIPTEPLTFVLNPNAEADQQFIAPEFTITNHTPTSIYLELSRFEQLTQVLTDVLPEAHDDWSQLDRAQSKEIALGLVPQPSAGWLSLEEGPRYVAADSNYYLGEVKANSSVDFTFTAHHGRAFVEALNPQYRLSFVFDFFDR